MVRIWQHVRSLLAIVPLAAGIPGVTQAQDSPPPSPQPRVFVVPLKGPLLYRMAAEDLAKIFRAANVQKPEAVILRISSPGGDRAVAFEIARQVADAVQHKTIAYVDGDYGGAYGEAVFPLLPCREVFVAPGSTINLQPNDEGDRSQAAPLTPREISLMQAWAAQNRLPWTPLAEWFGRAGLLGGDSQSTAVSPASQPASLHGLKPLRAREAADLEAVVARLEVRDPLVVTWPDPVARANETMRKMVLLADNLAKETNDAIAAARQTDPRAQRYELYDISRETAIGLVVVPDETGEVATAYPTIDRVTQRDVFSDGGASWRSYTDQCIAHVRKAMSANRRLTGLIARYPELAVDARELADSYATLNAWLNQLRSERELRSPPGNP